MDKLFMNAVGKSSISAKTKTYDIDELTEYVMHSGITIAMCKDITGKSLAKKNEYATYIAKKMRAGWDKDDEPVVKKKPAKKKAVVVASSDDEDEPVVKKDKPAKKKAVVVASSDDEDEPVVKKDKPAKKKAVAVASSDEEDKPVVKKDKPAKKKAVVASSDDEDEPVVKKNVSYETRLAKLKGVAKISDGTKAKDGDDLAKYVGTISVENLKKLTGNDTISDKSKLVKLAVSQLRKEWAS
jgi:hypothetical protein